MNNEEMLRWRKKMKEELPEKIKELDRDSKLDNINKNVRMLMFALTHQSFQDSLHKIHEYFGLKEKSIYEDFLQIVFIFLSILIGIAITKEKYIITALISGILILIFIIRSIKLKRDKEKYSKSRQYQTLLKFREEAEKNMDRLIE